MLNIDIGGEKHKRTFGNKWKILDIAKNSDYVFNLNSKGSFPFKNNFVNNIYCSHTLEHIQPENITFILKEIYRVLKINGICRVVVPDFSYGLKLYMNNSKELFNKRYCSITKGIPNTPMGRLTSWVHSSNEKQTGHKIGFDEELMRAFFKLTKFKVKKMKCNYCSNIFKGKDYERYAGWCLYFELTKK